APRTNRRTRTGTGCCETSWRVAATPRWSRRDSWRDSPTIADGALRPIAEMVHDIDLKDDKYGRPETAGIELVVNGIAMAHREDETRLARATAVLDDLYEYFKRKRTET